TRAARRPAAPDRRAAAGPAPAGPAVRISGAISRGHGRVPAVDDYAITVEGVAKSFGETKALDGVSFEVPRRTVCGLLGPNGAGKTTAVRILSGMSVPDAGRATVAGFDVATQAQSVRRILGLAAQSATVDELMTGRENLVMIGRLHHLGRATAKARAAELLDEFSLTDAADRLT